MAGCHLPPLTPVMKVTKEKWHSFPMSLDTVSDPFSILLKADAWDNIHLLPRVQQTSAILNLSSATY